MSFKFKGFLRILETETPGKVHSVVLRYNEGPRDCQNLFAITRFRYSYILLLLGQKISFVIPRTSLYRGSLNIEGGYQGNPSPDRKMIKLLRLLTFDKLSSVTMTFSLNPIVE